MKNKAIQDCKNMFMNAISYLNPLGYENTGDSFIVISSICFEQVHNSVQNLVSSIYRDHHFTINPVPVGNCDLVSNKFLCLRAQLR